MSNEHILIVDDEPSLQQAIAKYLDASAYTVGCVADATGLDGYMLKHQVDLLILDQMMPGEDGLSITKRLRASGNTIPILMISSFGEDVDRIIGLEMGVDDYLAKPVNLREVLARVRALLRRNQQLPVPAAANSSTYQFGPYSYNIETRQLFNSDKIIKLTAAEARLLKIFVQKPNQELSRDHLSVILRGYEHEPFDRSIDVQVKRLRERIELDTSSPQYIVTVWGKGYQFIPQADS
ncbi:MAG: response regulator [Gammaproteobacteria bacterium]|nr:response regulator [Gammaproteobacteria bacterium]